MLKLLSVLLSIIFINISNAANMCYTSNAGGGKIVILLEKDKNNNNIGYNYGADGRMSWLNWVYIDKNVIVLYEDGDKRIYPSAAFTCDVK